MTKLMAWAFVAVSVAGCATVPGNSTVAQKAVADGQLFCATATATGPLVVALADQLGAPVIVTNKAAADVAAACAVINAIPVSPPPVPASAPVVSVVVPTVMSTPVKP